MRGVRSWYKAGYGIALISCCFLLSGCPPPKDFRIHEIPITGLHLSVLETPANHGPDDTLRLTIGLRNDTHRPLVCPIGKILFSISLNQTEYLLDPVFWSTGQIEVVSLPPGDSLRREISFVSIGDENVWPGTHSFVLTYRGAVHDGNARISYRASSEPFELRVVARASTK